MWRTTRNTLSSLLTAGPTSTPAGLRTALESPSAARGSTRPARAPARAPPRRGWDGEEGEGHGAKNPQGRNMNRRELLKSLGKLLLVAGAPALLTGSPQE